MVITRLMKKKEKVKSTFDNIFTSTRIPFTDKTFLEDQMIEAIANGNCNFESAYEHCRAKILEDQEMAEPYCWTSHQMNYFENYDKNKIEQYYLALVEYYNACIIYTD